MRILQQVRRCKYCGSDMTDMVSSMSYHENPFCSGCLNERLEKAAVELPDVPIKFVRAGGYFHQVQWNDCTDCGAPNIEPRSWKKGAP